MEGDTCSFHHTQSQRRNSTRCVDGAEKSACAVFDLHCRRRPPEPGIGGPLRRGRPPEWSQRTAATIRNGQKTSTAAAKNYPEWGIPIATTQNQRIYSTADIWHGSSTNILDGPHPGRDDISAPPARAAAWNGWSE